MLRRLNQVSRHLSRSLPNYGHPSAATAVSEAASYQMASGPRKIHTAGCIIIGDEILNGKASILCCLFGWPVADRASEPPSVQTRDTNSHYLAKYCFELGVELKRIEVVSDDEAEIVEAARRFSRSYDFVVTSGGIGPT